MTSGSSAISISSSHSMISSSKTPSSSSTKSINSKNYTPPARNKVKTCFLAVLASVCVVAAGIFALAAVALLVGAIMGAASGGGSGALVFGLLTASFFAGFTIGAGCLAFRFFRKI